MSEFKPMVLCGHANEAPPTCSCPPDCGCREFMCRARRLEAEKSSVTTREGGAKAAPSGAPDYLNQILSRKGLL